MAKLLTGTRIYGTGTVDTQLFVSGTSVSTSTTTGALTVVGGVGIGGGLVVGGIVTATNFFIGGYAVSTASSLTIQSAGVGQGTAATINFSTGLTATVATNVATITVNTATLMTTAVTLANTTTAQVGFAANILGNGAGNGALVFQSAPNTTGFLGQGTAGWLLVSGGSGSPPAFTSTGSIYVNSAVNANNIIGGNTNQIPYQTAAGVTAFSSGLTFNGTTFTSTNVIIPGTTNSTNTITGALQVAGGVGVGGNLNVGGVITATNVYVNGYAVSTSSGSSFTGGAVINATTITNTTPTSSTNTGALQVVGGVGVGGGLFVGATVTASNILVSGTTNAVSTTTGALQVAGGLAIGKDLYVGGTLYIAGAGGSDIDMTGGDISNIGNLTANTATITRFIITATTGVFSTNTGVLQIAGGVGIAGGIFVGGVVTATTFVGSVAGSNITNTGTLQVGYAANILGGGTGSLPYQSAANTTAFLSLSGTQKSLLTAGATAPAYVTQVQATSGTGSTNATGGQSLVVTSGGLGVTGDSYFVNSIGINEGLTVYGSTTFSGPVTFNGTATTVASTNTYYTDNMLELHVPPSGVNGTWSVNDGKDIGLRLHYYNGADLNAGLVLSNSSKYLEWYSNGTENATGVFTTVTYGTFKTGSVVLTDTTGSATTQTGALTVVGGVGIGGGMTVGGVVTATAFVGNLTGTVTGAATSATTATNLAGGVKDQIPYQTSTGTTVFSSGLTYNGTVFTATNIIVPGTANATNTTTGAVQVAGGLAVGKDLYVGGTLYIAGAGGSDIDMTGGDISNIGNLTANTATISRAVVTATTGVYSTNTGALQIAGGVGVAGGMFVGGIITATNISIGGYAVSTSSSLTIQSAGVGQGTANTINFSTGLTATVATSIATVTVNTATLMTTAVNLAGGAATQIPYQSSTGTTAFSSNLTFDSVTGLLTCVDLNTTSDATLKDNIATIVNPQDILQNFRGVQFNWKHTGKLSYGLIAQELEKTLPELVETDKSGLKSIRYLPIIGILLEAIKYQQAQIDQLIEKVK